MLSKANETTLKECKKPYPDDLTDLIYQISETWVNSPERPRLNRKVVLEWDEVISSWIEDKTLPLFVRNIRAGRGRRIEHASGRILVPADNTPAHWSFMTAFSGHCPTIQDVHRLVDSDSIPIAMIFNKAERERADFKGERASIKNPNKMGWKVCHIEPVRMKARGTLEDRGINVLEEHFKYFLSPSNMFLVPKALAGIGEFESLIKMMKGRV